MVTKKLVEQKLREVLDPELGINIVDLGLIYNITVKNNNVSILTTLTFPGCPLGGTIKQEISERVSSIPNIGELNLKITFNPPWDLTKISPDARAEIGI
jgi:metal-sulfur cluster biosynthetic enzyme